jgi:microcystin-dependent protein
MADPFVAEIRIFPFSFAPKGWAWCNGQLLPLSQNTALFSLVGTYYGGDGKSNFALPDLQDNAPMHPGQGPGLSLYDLGEMSGAPNHTLLQTEIPIHTHTLNATDPQDAGNLQVGSPMRALAASGNGNAYNPPSPPVQMAFQASTPNGGDQPHNNMMPFMTYNFNIALQGVFPPRT